MTIGVQPATVFDDVRVMLGPKRPAANVCWCLSYRIPSKENRQLAGPARGERVRRLMQEGAPGVFARNRKIPYVDDLRCGPCGASGCARGSAGRASRTTSSAERSTSPAGTGRPADTGSVLSGFPRVLMRLDSR